MLRNPDSDSFTKLQAEDAQWLAYHPKSMLGHVAGWGKTRIALAAADILESNDTLVVAPAAIRDTRVWVNEARVTGFDRPLRVISYHQLAKMPHNPRPDIVILDESHHCRNPKISWRAALMRLSRQSKAFFELTGTPTPKHGNNLWAQLSLLRDDLGTYWKWQERWFHVEPTQFTRFNVTNRLKECYDGNYLCQNATCRHWDEFYRYHYDGWVLRRTESDMDLPDMVGLNVPMLTPMAPDQKRMYNELAKDFMATYPDGGLLEIFHSGAKFAALRRISTSIGAVDIARWDTKSGKTDLLHELLANTSQHVITVAYKPTADYIRKQLEHLGISYVEFSSKSTPKQRANSVDTFQSGGAQVMLGGVEVIKEGITLVAASSLISVERSWLPDTNLQVAKRVHRRGQTQTVVVRNLVTPESADFGQWLDIQERRVHVGQVVKGAGIEHYIKASPGK